MEFFLRYDRVRHVMTEAVQSIDVHEPVTELLRLLADHAIRHLPVTDGEHLCGMVSSADLLKLEHFMPRSGQPGALLNERLRIDQMMRSPVTSIDPDAPIGDAVGLMSRHGIHALPVIGADQRLMGIVTTTDIMAGLLRRLRQLSGDADETPASAGVTSSVQSWSHAVNAAHAAIAAGRDPDGVAAATLSLHHRNALLEALRRDVTRYLKFAQDPQLHTRLLQDLDALDAETTAPP